MHLLRMSVMPVLSTHILMGHPSIKSGFPAVMFQASMGKACSIDIQPAEQVAETGDTGMR